MELVERIDALCKAHGITFNQLEKAIGLKSTIARWKDHSPAIDKVMLVASYYGLTVSELIGETEPASISTDGITESINSLTPEFREVFVRFLASAKEQPERARRYLSFAIQELESH